jgi:hypothetical protein
MRQHKLKVFRLKAEVFGTPTLSLNTFSLDT